MKSLIKIVLAFLICLPCFGQNFLNSYIQFPTGASYLIKQNFEGTGYDNSEAWSESGTGTMDEDYATSPMEGSQSLRIALSSTTGRVSSPAFTAQSDLWAYFQIKILGSLPAATTTIAEMQAASTDCLRLRLLTSGALDVRAGGGTPVATTGTLTPGTVYHVWIHYIAGTGANGFSSVGFSPDGTKPTSGTNYAEMTTGTATASPSSQRLGQSTSATIELLYDKVRVSASAIGDNP
jgi:hypothetical protein